MPPVYLALSRLYDRISSIHVAYKITCQIYVYMHNNKQWSHIQITVLFEALFGDIVWKWHTFYKIRLQSDRAFFSHNNRGRDFFGRIQKNSLWWDKAKGLMNVRRLTLFRKLLYTCMHAHNLTPSVLISKAKRIHTERQMTPKQTSIYIYIYIYIERERERERDRERELLSKITASIFVYLSRAKIHSLLVVEDTLEFFVYILIFLEQYLAI
jgi:hypothetical protein